MRGEADLLARRWPSSSHDPRPSRASRRWRSSSRSSFKKKAEPHVRGRADLLRGHHPLPRRPKWGLAAMSRLGMMYHDVAEQIQRRSVPAAPHRRPVPLLRGGAHRVWWSSSRRRPSTSTSSPCEKAAELGWFSDYTTLAQRRLFDLRPDEYRSASEIKAQPEPGARERGTSAGHLRRRRGRRR